MVLARGINPLFLLIVIHMGLLVGYPTKDKHLGIKSQMPPFMDKPTCWLVDSPPYSTTVCEALSTCWLVDAHPLVATPGDRKALLSESTTKKSPKMKCLGYDEGCPEDSTTKASRFSDDLVMIGDGY